MDDSNCFLCDRQAEKQLDDTDTFEIVCSRCGHYRITRQCSFNARSADDRTLAAISASTRRANDDGRILVLTMETWDQIAAGRR